VALILVVDDSQMVQKAVKDLLEKKEHRIRMAGTVRTAVNRIRSQKFDLILMDLNLPDARGEEAIRELRLQMKVKTPIIVLSGEIKAETVIALKPFGISGFVIKSDDFERRLDEEVDKSLSYLD